jgi:surface antigen
VIGGVVGVRAGDDNNRPIAILLGSVVGAVIGANIGKSVEDADKACMAHSLELANDNRPVSWNNPNTGAHYVVTPHEGFEERGHVCRNFDVMVRMDGRDHPSQGKACEVDGAWRIQ